MALHRFDEEAEAIARELGIDHPVERRAPRRAAHDIRLLRRREFRPPVRRHRAERSGIVIDQAEELLTLAGAREGEGAVSFGPIG